MLDLMFELLEREEERSNKKKKYDDLDHDFWIWTKVENYDDFSHAISWTRILQQRTTWVTTTQTI